MSKINFSGYTIQQYLDQLSRREPVPGGGSAAAITASLGVGLLMMVTQYSIGRKSNSKAIDRKLSVQLPKLEAIRNRLTELASLDSEAYLQLTNAKGADIKIQRQAAKYAKAVPQEIGRLCFKAINMAPFLVDKGNPYLLSDVEVAIELLMAGFNGAQVMVRVNS